MKFITRSIGVVSLVIVGGAMAQASWTDGYAYLAGTYQAGSDIVVTTEYGPYVFAFTSGIGPWINSDYSYSDGISVVESYGYNEADGPGHDNAGAISSFYWIATNYGSVAETIDWTFTTSLFSEADNTGQMSFIEDMIGVADYNSQTSILFDQIGVDPLNGYASVSDSPSATYSVTIQPGQYDLIMSYTYQDSLLQTPGVAACVPFALGAISLRRRRKARVS